MYVGSAAIEVDQSPYTISITRHLASHAFLYETSIPKVRLMIACVPLMAHSGPFSTWCIMHSAMSFELSCRWSLEFETRIHMCFFTNVTIFHILCVHLKVPLSCQLYGREALWDLQRTYQVVDLLSHTLYSMLCLIDKSLTACCTSFFVSNFKDHSQFKLFCPLIPHIVLL